MKNKKWTGLPFPEVLLLFHSSDTWWYLQGRFLFSWLNYSILSYSFLVAFQVIYLEKAAIQSLIKNVLHDLFRVFNCQASMNSSWKCSLFLPFYTCFLSIPWSITSKLFGACLVVRLTLYSVWWLLKCNCRTRCLGFCW